MSQTEQKKNSPNQERKWFFTFAPEVLVIVAGIFALYFYLLGAGTLVNFLVTWTAGILGIMTGFALDRRAEQNKDNEIKEDFLALIRNELVEIKGKIPPQTQIPLMLYPEIWDSFVSSGLIRLLSSEQVRKLSSVYKFIKGTQYEAEWVRRAVEEHTRVPTNERDKKASSLERLKELQVHYSLSGQELSQQIEKILEEKWWSNSSNTKRNN